MFYNFSPSPRQSNHQIRFKCSKSRKRVKKVKIRCHCFRAINNENDYLLSRMAIEKYKRASSEVFIQLGGEQKEEKKNKKLNWQNWFYFFWLQTARIMIARGELLIYTLHCVL